MVQAAAGTAGSTDQVQRHACLYVLLRGADHTHAYQPPIQSPQTSSPGRRKQARKAAQQRLLEVLQA